MAKTQLNCKGHDPCDLRHGHIHHSPRLFSRAKSCPPLSLDWYWDNVPPSHAPASMLYLGHGGPLFHQGSAEGGWDKVDASDPLGHGVTSGPQGRTLPWFCVLLSVGIFLNTGHCQTTVLLWALQVLFLVHAGGGTLIDAPLPFSYQSVKNVHTEKGLSMSCVEMQIHCPKVEDLKGTC